MILKSTYSSISNDQMTSDTSVCTVTRVATPDVFQTAPLTVRFACRLSRKRIFTFVSLAESSSSIFIPFTNHAFDKKASVCLFVVVFHFHDDLKDSTRMISNQL